MGRLGQAGALAVAAIALALVLGVERRDAFWLDESWTGGIIAQPTWRAAFQQIYWDVNAPLYYVLIRLWSTVFGLSDWALRAPSLIAALATPLLTALAPSPGLTRAQRLAWSAVLAFWFPALCYAAEARCYALLLLVSTAQTLAFMRLIQAPRTGRVVVWATLAALAILTHYDALYLGAAQGLVYLARAPRRAVASWPAALAFIPAFGWLAFHAPRIAEFARPDIAWYAPLHLAELPLIGAYLADGGEAMPKWLAALALSAVTLRLLPLPRWIERSGGPADLPHARVGQYGRSQGGGRPAAEGALAALSRSVSDPFGATSPSRMGRISEAVSPALWAIAAAALAAVVLVAVGFLRPSFTFRYLTPCAPGLLLGLVVLARGLAGRRGEVVALTMLGAVYLGVSGWMLTHHLRMAPRRYNFETASAALARSRPSRLVFLWDHPVDPILHPGQLAALGGFFLHRAGEPTPVDAVILKPGEDPNPRLVAGAQAPGSAILWLYDRVVRGTAANARPPDLVRLDPRLRCRDFGSVRFGVLACVRR